jgi:RNA polymerase sigma-70 factor (ECF subfamily)
VDAKDLFEILVREHASMLTAYLRAVVRDSAAADDLFQETMLVAWRRLPDYDRTRPFAPWLRAIAARLMPAHFRKQKRAHPLAEESVLEALEVRFDQLARQPGDTFDERLDCLRDCLAKLPEHYREPVRLRYAEDLALEDAAMRLGINFETIKKRLQRARAQLLACVNRKLSASTS